MKNTKVIYTVIVGHYDTLQQPLIIRKDFDYICFTEHSSLSSGFDGVWKIVEIPPVTKDKIRLSRYPKLLPHATVLSAYEYSLYVDANLVIQDEYVYFRVDELIEDGVNIALIKHPARDCVFQEAYNCIAGCKAGWVSLLKHILFLKRKKIPSHNGLYEANVIYRKHNDELIMRLDNDWWNGFLKHSKRDQLSLVYALWINKIDVNYFLPEGFSTINHPSFKRLPHIPQRDSFFVTMKKKIVKVIINAAKARLKD